MLQFLPLYILVSTYYVMGICTYAYIYLKNQRVSMYQKKSEYTVLNAIPMNSIAETDFDIEYAGT
jgi:hypothetical protein